MRIIKSVAIILSLCCFVCGCKTTIQHNIQSSNDSGNSPIIQPSSDGGVVIIPPNNGRDDLPFGWNAVGFDNWSYGVPSDFNTNSIDGGSALASSNSTVQGLTVEFEKTPTSIKDLHQYVLSDFVLVKMAKNAEILQERTKNNTDGEETVCVQVLMPKTKIGQISSLDFFRMKNQVVYHLSCYGDLVSLKQNKDTCFEIADTLKINN